MSGAPLTKVDDEQARFIEEQTSAFLAYTIDCLDANRAEGNNVLQWLFGVTVAGMGAVGALWVAGYPVLSLGFLGAVIGAMKSAADLVIALRGRPTAPPGNLAINLNTMLDDTPPRMRWRAAKGMDAKIEANLKQVSELGRAVDQARRRFVQLPAWFMVCSLLALIGREAVRS